MCTVTLSIAQKSDTTYADDQKVIQFTGVIFTSDSLAVVPGVHVYVPKGGRGTTTNPYGFFSMPALAGDSVVFSAVGFERTSFVVPAHDSEFAMKVMVYLKEDVTYLSEVEVFPYPSEATFKAAVLASTLPGQDQIDRLDEWLNEEYMRTAYWDLPASPNMNHRYFMREQMDARMYRYQSPSNPLLNPFAWATFLRSLKKK
ncbi:MAG: carboxypeptidase-like regulatory domain-containing protein [Cyclobacteriaceae bacterium]